MLEIEPSDLGSPKTNRQSPASKQLAKEEMLQKIREAVKSHFKNKLLRKTPLKVTRPARDSSVPVFKILKLGYK